MLKRPQIVAHRGYSARYRENSVAAWRGAMAAGADFIEVDLRVCAGGEVVCIHDADLQRLAGRSERVAEISAAGLKAIEVAGEPVALPIATLFDVVSAQQHILFDIKDESPFALEVIVGAVTSVSRSTIMLGLHTVDALVRSKRLGWHGPVLGLLTDMVEEDAFFAAGGDIVRLWESAASSDAIRQRLDQGRAVWVTTGQGTTGRKGGDHDAGVLRVLAEAGADGFLVNDPLSTRQDLAYGPGIWPRIERNLER